MLRQSFGRGRKVLAAALLAGIGAITLAAVAGGAQSSPSTKSTTEAVASVIEAKRLVAKAQQPVAWSAPGKPYDATKAKGKSIWYNSFLLTIPFEQFMCQGIKQAARAVGASAQCLDGKSSAAEFTKGIQQAVAAKADAIILGGITPSFVAPALADAKKAGVAVIASHTQDPGRPLRGTPSSIVAVATHSYSYPGKLEADFVVADSNGKGNAIFLESSDVGVISALGRDAFKKEMARLCPSCKVKVINVPIAQWGSLQTKTASIIQSNPDYKYIVAVFDGMVLFMVPSVHAANAQNTVKIVSFNGTPAVMTFMKNKDVVAADVGGANLWQGWGIADQTFRVLTGAPKLLDIRTPQRLFTRANINSINLKAQESTWYSKVNYKAAYLKQWKVKK
jgi:ribose transport system substrate-binding protein